MDFKSLLELMVKKNAFELFIVAGRAPAIKIDGVLTEVSKTILGKEQTHSLVLSVMDSRQKEEFNRTKECQFAFGIANIGRFRASAFTQRDSSCMVLHRINHEIPDIDSLHLPAILKELVMKKSGLILFAGAVGSGKSTSVNSIIQHRNRNSKGHIIVVDDSMKFIHSHAGCIVTQREIGIDTASYDVALNNAMQQSPDVIAIGEISSGDIMQYALRMVERRHLCISTIYADNAEQAVERIISFFPDEMHAHIRLELSLTLVAIISQKMVHCSDGNRYVISEILLNSSEQMAEVLRRGDVHRFKELIALNEQQGMQSFDQSCLNLLLQRKISYDDACNASEYKNEFRLMAKPIMSELGRKLFNSVDSSIDSSISDSIIPLADTDVMTLSNFEEESDKGSIFTRR